MVIKDFLRQRKEEGLLRQLCPASARRGCVISFNGKKFIDFSSNDYLGFSCHPRLIEAGKKALDEFGASSSASRLLSGDLLIHHQLEEKTAHFKRKEAALVFNTGYQANVGIISALYGKSDCIFSDRLCHASIIDGIFLSGAKHFRYRHNDSSHLELLLKKERGKFKRALIITETIFSMDGDRALLGELACLKEKYDCQLMVDEAHATGIFGENGSGVVEEEGVEKKVDFIMGTFSKALGSFGAYLAASKKVKEYLVNTCRSFIYSTALPPPVIACNLAALDLVGKEPWRRKSLLGCAAYLRDALGKKGFQIKGCSQIIPVIIGENPRAVKLTESLQEQGYWILPIRPPTVPRGQSRLRISLNYFHDQEILNRFIEVIANVRD